MDSGGGEDVAPHNNPAQPTIDPPTTTTTTTADTATATTQTLVEDVFTTSVQDDDAAAAAAGEPTNDPTATAAGDGDPQQPLDQPTVAGIYNAVVHLQELLASLPAERLAEILLVCSERGQLDIVQLAVQHLGVDVNTRAPDGSTPLLLACFSNKIDVVEWLILLGKADVNITDNEGYTPLHIACKRGNEEAVRALVSLGGADVEARCRGGLTPLRISSQENLKSIVEFLHTTAQADVNTRDDELVTPLHLACKGNNLEMANLLIRFGADVNAMSCDGLTPVSVASQSRLVEMVRMLLTHHCDVNTPAADGLTPLLVACQKGDMEIIKLLVEEGGAAPGFVSEGTVTPLFLACGEGHLDVVRYLVGLTDVRFTLETCITPLLIACRHAHIDVLDFLFNHTNVYALAPEAKATHVAMTLWHACDRGCTAVVAYLVENHADCLQKIPEPTHPETESEQQQREAANLARQNDLVAVLFTACRAGYTEIVRLMIENLGMSPYACSGDGFTPMFVACIKGHVDVARYLALEAQVNLDDRDRHMGGTALHISCAQNQLDIVRFLVCEAKINVESRDSQNRTALWTACAVGGVEVVEFLINVGGADVNATDVTNFTPLEAACKAGKLDIVRFLLQNTSTDRVRLSRVMFVAAQEGYVELVQFLVNELHVPATITDPDFPDLTPLSVACSAGNLNVVKFLISDAHVDPNAGMVIQNDFELTPLRVASHHGRLEIVFYLVSHGRANIDVYSQALAETANHKHIAEWLRLARNWSPLHIACSVRDPELVVKELRGRADPAQRDPISRLSPIDLAINAGILAQKGWSVAMCPICIKALHDALSPWSPDTNYTWCDDMRRSARTTLLLAHKLKKEFQERLACTAKAQLQGEGQGHDAGGEAPLPLLPHEIWLHIALMMSTTFVRVYHCPINTPAQREMQHQLLRQGFSEYQQHQTSENRGL